LALANSGQPRIVGRLVDDQLRRFIYSQLLGGILMKKVTALLLSATTALLLGLFTINASADSHVASTYGKALTSGGSCVKGSGKTLCNKPVAPVSKKKPMKKAAKPAKPAKSTKSKKA
jgi:hypothetical protein